MQKIATPLSQASDAELAVLSANVRDDMAETAAGGFRERLGDGVLRLAVSAGVFTGITYLAKSLKTSLFTFTPAEISLISVTAGLGEYEKTKARQDVAAQAQAGLAAEHLLRQRAEAKLAEATALASASTHAPHDAHAKTHQDTPEHAAPEKKREDVHALKHDAAHPHAAPEAHHETHPNQVHAAQHEGTVAGHAHAHEKAAGSHVHI